MAINTKIPPEEKKSLGMMVSINIKKVIATQKPLQIVYFSFQFFLLHKAIQKNVNFTSQSYPKVYLNSCLK